MRTDRIPIGSLDHGFVYNFWQDAKNPKGLWRRTTIADYADPVAALGNAAGRRRAGRRRKRRIGCSRAPNARPSETRCLIRLSRGGGDAVVVREYDLKAKKLATDGFTLPEAKTDATYLDDDTVLFATDFGNGSSPIPAMPASSNCGSAASRSRRAKTLYEGQVERCAVVARHVSHQGRRFRPGDPRGEFFRNRILCADAATATVSKLPICRCPPIVKA